MRDFQRIKVAYGGQEYISEFDNDSLKRCEDMGVMGMKEKPTEFAFTCFFCSLLKNHPYASHRKVKEFFDSVIFDEEYGVDAFTEITEEFVRLYSMFFMGKGKGKKKFTPDVPAQTVAFPKTDKA